MFLWIFSFDLSHFRVCILLFFTRLLWRLHDTLFNYSAMLPHQSCCWKYFAIYERECNEKTLKCAYTPALNYIYLFFLCVRQTKHMYTIHSAHSAYLEQRNYVNVVPDIIQRLKLFRFRNHIWMVPCPPFNWQHLGTVELENTWTIEIESCVYMWFMLFMKRWWCDDNVKSSIGTFYFYFVKGKVRNLLTVELNVSLNKRSDWHIKYKE